MIRDLPPNLRKALATKAAAQKVWKSLTRIARRDFISWIESAKQPQTRKLRAERVPNLLASGKRRPCCYALVPMNLYKALGSNPKAKKQWSGLTPDERRDFVQWIDSEKVSIARGVRIASTCHILASGKRRP